MNTSTLIHTLPNGLTLVGEPSNKQAVAWSLQLPAGSATEPAGKDGLTSVLDSVLYRGAGERDSRELSDALDDLGIERGGGAEVESVSFGGATLGLYLADALQIYADIVRRPRLPEDEWEAARDLALQSLDSLEDSPSRKMFVHLRRNWFTSGHRRAAIGTREGLESLTLEDLRADHAARFRPDGAVLAVAGGFDWAATVAQVEELFGDWTGKAPELESPQVVEEPLFQHIEQDTAQQQIGVAYLGVPSTDADFYAFRVATDILSGGMGARLFSEVREKARPRLFGFGVRVVAQRHRLHARLCGHDARTLAGNARRVAPRTPKDARRRLARRVGTRPSAPDFEFGDERGILPFAGRGFGARLLDAGPRADSR